MSTYCKCGYPVDMAALERNRQMIAQMEWRRRNPPIYETVRVAHPDDPSVYVDIRRECGFTREDGVVIRFDLGLPA